MDSDLHLPNPVTCSECKKTVARTFKEANGLFGVLKNADNETVFCSKCMKCNPRRHVSCEQCGVEANSKEEEDLKFCEVEEGVPDRVCLACNEKECQKKEDERKREREQKEEEEEEAEGEEEEGDHALQFISYEAMNYETLFSDEVVDAAFQAHSTSHGPHYVRVAEQLLRLAHAQRINVFLRVKGDSPVLFTASDSGWIFGDGSDQSLCHGKGFPHVFLTSFLFFIYSIHAERFNLAIYDVIQKGIGRNFQNEKADVKLDDILLKQPWMKVVLMGFDPKATAFVTPHHPALVQSQTPRRRKVPAPHSASKKKSPFMVDHMQQELRKAIETKVREMMEQNKSLEEELNKDLIGKGVIPKQANWFYFDQGLSGGIAKFPGASKVLKLIIATGKGGESPTQLGDPIVDGDLHAKIERLVANNKLKPKRVNPGQKKQKKSDNND